MGGWFVYSSHPPPHTGHKQRFQKSRLSFTMLFSGSYTLSDLISNPAELLQWCSCGSRVSGVPGLSPEILTVKTVLASPNMYK